MRVKNKQYKIFGSGRSGKSAIFINLGLVILSLVVCVFGIEIILRLSGYSAPLFRKGNVELGWSLYPGIEGMHRKERDNYLRINEKGFNDQTRNITKPSDTIRVAIIGDSFTEAAEVPREENFCSLAESELSAYFIPQQKNIEVLNFGVVGYGTSQQLLQLRKTVWQYDPDIIVLAVYMGNDISDNHYQLAESIRDVRPYFVYQGGKLKRETGFPNAKKLKRERIVTEIINHSRLMQLVKEAARRRHGGRKKTTQPAPPNPGKNDDVFLKPTSNDWAEAWEVSEQLILQISREVRSRGKEFLMMTIATPVRVHPDNEVRKAFAAKLGAEHLDYPDQRLALLAQKGNIPLLQLAPELARYAETEDAFFHGFDQYTQGTGHWNKKGHEQVAHLLSARLKRMIEEDGVLY